MKPASLPSRWTVGGVRISSSKGSLQLPGPGVAQSLPWDKEGGEKSRLNSALSLNPVVSLRCPQPCRRKGMGSVLAWMRAWRNSSPKG